MSVKPLILPLFPVFSGICHFCRSLPVSRGDRKLNLSEMSVLCLKCGVQKVFSSGVQKVVQKSVKMTKMAIKQATMALKQAKMA